MKLTLKLLLIQTIVLICSCAGGSKSDKKYFYLKDEVITSGEKLEILYDREIVDSKCSLSLIDNNRNVIENYSCNVNNNNKKIIVNRFINKKINVYNSYKLKISADSSEYFLPLNIGPSVIIESLCGTENCSTLSGNLIENIKNKLSISTYKIMTQKVVYNIITPYQSYELINEFNSPVNNDWIELKLNSIPDGVSSYIARIDITVYDQENNIAETSLPFKVVRPLEIKHFGLQELAQIYEPVPVTGCIPGTVGSNVQYSESTSETRQNSLSVTINQDWSNSLSTNNTISNSEGISVGQTQGTVNSSSLTNSETQSESYSSTQSEGESNNISFNTNEGEVWTWSINESNSQTDGQSQSQGTNTAVNASSTVGMSGEGSLPFLAKASGKVEVSAGVQRGWNESSNNSSSETNSESRGYTTSGSSQNGRTYGSIQNDSRSHTLNGAYVLSSTTGNTVSESSSLSSGRVWNMSESISSGNVVTVGSSESISQTIVESNSSTTTFSYSGYIPRGRFGIFFRQTSRYVKLSEIITYDLNGFPIHSGFIMMNNWAWAPELSVSNTCEGAMNFNLPKAECLIEPCDN